MEGTQIRIKLTTNPEVLEELKKKKQFRVDSEGHEYYSRQFDSLEFAFYPNKPRVFDASIAKALLSGSLLVVGDAYTGPQLPALEKVTEFSVGTSDESFVPPSKTLCPYCNKDFVTPGKLGFHLMHTPKEGDGVHPSRTDEDVPQDPVPVIKDK